GVLKCQLYWPDSAGYTENRSEVADVPDGDWTTVKLELSVPLGRLRFDPVNCPSVIEIEEMRVISSSTGLVLWDMDAERMGEIEFGGTAIQIPTGDGLTVFSYGDDPQLILPTILPPSEAASLQFTCRIRIDRGFHLLGQTFQRYLNTLREEAHLR